MLADDDDEDDADDVAVSSLVSIALTPLPPPVIARFGARFDPLWDDAELAAGERIAGEFEPSFMCLVGRSERQTTNGSIKTFSEQVTHFGFLQAVKHTMSDVYQCNWRQI